MSARETLLTPELAAQLLANPHPRQRRIGPNIVTRYARLMKQGKWNAAAATHDPILIDKATGQMFNGAHRCSAVIASKVSVKVVIDYDADAAIFDYIDIGRGRNASQFIRGKNASLRASATRVVLWHEILFDHPMGSVSTYWQMAEVLDESERLSPYFDRLTQPSDAIYTRTGLSRAVVLGALTLASLRGHEDQAVAFAHQIESPTGLTEDDPAYYLTTRMSLTAHRKRARQPLEDWMIFVRCLNAYITADRLPRKLQVTTAWPLIGESEKDFMRRNTSLAGSRADKLARAQDKRVRNPVVPYASLLEEIENRPGMTYAELGQAVGLAPSTISNYILDLRGQGLVRTRQGSARGSAIRVYPEQGS